MMKIALIAPICSDLGVCTIAPLLKNEGHNVKILFIPQILRNCSKPLPRKFSDRVSEFVRDSSLVGINGLSENYYNTASLVNRIRETTKVPVIWGGIHATLNPEECIKHADIVCVGEGEEAMMELARKMEKGEELKSIKNLIFREEPRNAGKAELRPPIDLNLLLPLDYDLDSQYILEGRKIRKLEEIDFGGMFYGFSSRSCPYHCTYCSNTAVRSIYGLRSLQRQRSVKKTIEDLKTLKGKFRSCRKIWFNEGDFLSGKTQAMIEDFAKEYKEKVGVPFSIWSHPVAVTEDNIRALRGAGLVQVNIGTLNASDRIQRQIYKRNASPELYKKKAEILNKYDMDVEYDLILCNPYEDDTDLKSTAQLIIELPKPFKIVLNTLTYFRHTELYNRVVADGIIDENDYIQVPSYTKTAYKVWKFKNKSVYMNIVLSLTRGWARKAKLLKTTFYGVCLPEPILKFLIKNPVIKFFNNLPLRSFFYGIIGDIIRIAYTMTEWVSSLFGQISLSIRRRMQKAFRKSSSFNT